VYHFVQHHLRDVLLDVAGFSPGSRTGLAVLLGHPTRAQELPSQHGAAFLHRENTSQRKKVPSGLGAQVEKFNRKRQRESNRTGSGSGANCCGALKFVGLGAQPSFTTSPVGKAPHKVHRVFPRVRDCRIWTHGRQEINFNFHFGKTGTVKS